MTPIERLARLLPNGKPRWIRCYDNGGTSVKGGTVDRYTVVYTGHYRGRDGVCHFVTMSSEPFHPQGVGQHGEDRNVIDRPAYSHLGRRIRFDALPPDCKKLVLRDYIEMWGLKGLAAA